MSFEDIIPIDALLGKKTQAKFEDNTPVSNGKKKIDREAMQSAIMRIPPNGCKGKSRPYRYWDS